MYMTKDTLKELKKEYKKARLFQESTSVDAIEQQLRQELSEDAWQVFVADVEAFLENVQSLAIEVAAKAKDQHEIMVEPALAPYLERAKALGGGAQKYIKMVFDSRMNALYMSRTPIPYPFKSLDFRYYKHVGIIGYNRKMLKFRV